MTPNNFIKWLYPIAKEIGEISPIFITAQAALESGWGTKAIGNNLFGITIGSSWKGKKILVLTTEYFNIPSKKFNAPERIISVVKLGNSYKYRVYRYFRNYDSVVDCLSDHLTILRKAQFADAWPFRMNARKYVMKLQDNIGLKYATSVNYVRELNCVIGCVEKTIERFRL